MRLFSKRQNNTDASDAVDAAREATAAAAERLASAVEVRARSARQAAHEQRTIIADLREMRRHDNLADLIAASATRRR